MTCAAIRPTPLVLRRLCRTAYSSRCLQVLGRTALAAAPRSQHLSSEIVQRQPWTASLVGPAAQAVGVVAGKPVRRQARVGRERRQHGGSRAADDRVLLSA
jgi:hypothetical protein